MFKAGFYEADITPPLFLNMGGYPNVRLAETVIDNLYAKAAVFEEGETKTAILSVDMCSLQQPECEEILDRIEKYTDIKRENVLLCADHTHKGYPYFINSKDEIIDALRKVFVCRAADSVIMANQRLSEVMVSFGEEYEDTVAKNREYLMEDGRILTNPGRLKPGIVKSVGNIDPAVPVLSFTDKDGSPKGCVMSYSCHQDAVGLELGYSGDYQCIISKELKKEFGDDFVCVFLLGCCGDINHVDVFRPFIDKQYKEMAAKLSPKVISAIKTGKKIENPELANIKEPVKVYKIRVDMDTIKERTEAYIEMNKLYWIRDMINRHISDEPDEQELRVQCMKIGDVLIYAIPGEVFVDFQLDIKKKSPTEKNIFASLANGSSGYIPTKDVFKNPYSYEAVPRNWAPETGEILTNRLCEIAKEMF